MDITSDITGITTQKDINNPSGSFGITLVRRRSYETMLRSADYLTIEMKKIGEDKYDPIICGVIDFAKTSQQIDNNGKTTIRAIINGSDLSKYLLKHLVLYLPEMQPRGYMPLITNLEKGIMFHGTADQIAKSILEGFFRHDKDQIKLSTGNSILEHFDYSLMEDFSDKSIEPMGFLLSSGQILNYQGTVYNALKQYCNLPFTELFFDVISDSLKHGVYLRRPPFWSYDLDKNDIHKPWDSMIVHDIHKSEIASGSNLGFGDYDTYTLWRTIATLYIYDHMNQLYFKSGSINWDDVKVAMPIMESYKAIQYGLRPANYSSLYIPYARDISIGVTVENMLFALTGRLWDWYFANHFFLQGDLPVRGKPDYHIGQGLRIRYGSDTSEKWQFYIDRVQQTWTLDNGLATNLHLSRGQTASIFSALREIRRIPGWVDILIDPDNQPRDFEAIEKKELEIIEMINIAAAPLWEA